jgi:hypothetical protein
MEFLLSVTRHGKIADAFFTQVPIGTNRSVLYAQAKGLSSFRA